MKGLRAVFMVSLLALSACALETVDGPTFSSPATGEGAASTEADEPAVASTEAHLDEAGGPDGADTVPFVSGTWCCKRYPYPGHCDPIADVGVGGGKKKKCPEGTVTLKCGEGQLHLCYCDGSIHIPSCND